FFVHRNSDSQRGESISIIKSTDKGVTWSRTSTVVAASLERGAFDPDTGRPIRAEGGIPEIAVDRSTGKLYAVWQDTRFSGGDETRLSPTSFDIEQAPAARGPFGYFLGEYEGLANAGSSFVFAFIQVNDGNAANRTDVFETKVSP